MIFRDFLLDLFLQVGFISIIIPIIFFTYGLYLQKIVIKYEVSRLIIEILGPFFKFRNENQDLNTYELILKYIKDNNINIRDILLRYINDPQFHNKLKSNFDGSYIDTVYYDIINFIKNNENISNELLLKYFKENANIYDEILNKYLEQNTETIEEYKNNDKETIRLTVFAVIILFFIFCIVLFVITSHIFNNFSLHIIVNNIVIVFFVIVMEILFFRFIASTYRPIYIDKIKEKMYIPNNNKC